mmetsp:Transcript_57271/g.186207  ORF Transcript_57271/g.186207 Transcript_57271/m.186207 type:complete len:249 (+) Transcript_57271:595-1341(+)
MHIQVTDREDAPTHHKEHQARQRDEWCQGRVGDAHKQHEQQRGEIRGQVWGVRLRLGCVAGLGLRGPSSAAAPPACRSPEPSRQPPGEPAQEDGRPQQAHWPHDERRREHGGQEVHRRFRQRLPQLPQDRRRMIHDCFQRVPYAARQRCDHDGRQLEAPISPHGHHLEGAPRLEAFVAKAQKMQDEGQQLEQAQESHHRQVQCHERIKIRAHQVQRYLQPRQEFLQPVDGAPCLEQRHRHRPKCHAEE